MPRKISSPRKRTFFTAAAASLSIAALASFSQLAKAQSCTPLTVVDSEETEVTKTVSLPGILFTRSNWDTDFVVGRPYNYFVVTFESLGGNPYDIDVFLKYPDGSFDASYHARERSIPANEPFTITAESRVSSDPYQVNLRVGGITSEGNTYTASVAGCI
ncbi:MAG: hypothetical protein AAFV85_27615 [Cyanobacteria bacterium J06634_6]